MSSSTSGTTGEECAPWTCDLGCPSGHRCAGEVCRNTVTGEVLCGPEPCDVPCAEGSTVCGDFACISGLCVPPSGAPFCATCNPACETGTDCGPGPANCVSGFCIGVRGVPFCPPDECELWLCEDGCPDTAECLSIAGGLQVCADPVTDEPLCAPECKDDCRTHEDCGLLGVLFCSGGGKCVDASGTLACAPLN